MGFKSYASLEAAIRDHAEFFASNPLDYVVGVEVGGNRYALSMRVEYQAEARRPSVDSDQQPQD